MAFILAGLEPPTNVARRVRELQQTLYRRWGLISPLSLPPLIPLIFFDPGKSEQGSGGGQAGGGAAYERPGAAAADAPATAEAAFAAASGAAPGPARVSVQSPQAAEERAVRRLAEALRRSLRGPAAPRAPRLRTAGLAVVGIPDPRRGGGGPSGRPARERPSIGPQAEGFAPAALYWEFDEGPDQSGAGAAPAALAELVRARVEAGPGWPLLLPPPFPVHSGFFLALQEPGIDLCELAAAVPRPEPLVFPALALSVMRVHRLRLEPLARGAAAGAAAAQGAAEPFEQPPWWRALFWEELLNVPLKKPFKAPP